jgi:hypothetical protein
VALRDASSPAASVFLKKELPAFSLLRVALGNALCYLPADSCGAFALRIIWVGRSNWDA